MCDSSDVIVRKSKHSHKSRPRPRPRDPSPGTTSRSQRKAKTQKREKQLNRCRLDKMTDGQISTGNYQMVPSLNPMARFSQQQLDMHGNHCTDGCKTRYTDQDIRSVTWLSRGDHCKKIKNDFFSLLAQDVLTIEFVDGSLHGGTTAEIAKQHYFCTDVTTGEYEISGNLSCHKCNTMLYWRCDVCGFVSDDVVYRFSQDKYKK